jgi:hypothetical protein
MGTGDLQPYLQATLLNPDNTPANLTGASVVFTMSQRGVTLFSNPALIVDATAGFVQYNWQPGNTDYYGSCKGVFTVTYPSGLTQTFPVGADLNIVFPMQYPQFTTLDEVISHLNVTGPDTNDNFTVFGLTISADSVQAHVDHANKYLYSLVPGLTPLDSCYVSAQLAALDIACLGVLVTSVGGSLVGAYDYFLGDMRVARAGPYASAIKAAIDGYRSSAVANLANMTTLVSATEASAAGNVPRYRGGLVSP